jgi:hypothetical protein
MARNKQDIILEIGEIIGSYTRGCVICKGSVNNELELGDIFEVHYNCYKLAAAIVELNHA